MSYDRLGPTISSKAKKLPLVPVTWVKIIGGCARPPVPLSDGLDTGPCKILDPRLMGLTSGVRYLVDPVGELRPHEQADVGVDVRVGRDHVAVVDTQQLAQHSPVAAARARRQRRTPRRQRLGAHQPQLRRARTAAAAPVCATAAHSCLRSQPGV